MKKVATPKARAKKSKASNSKKAPLVRKSFLVASVTAGVVAALFIFGIVLVVNVQKQKAIREDHLKPLMISNLEYCNGEKLDLIVPNRGKPVPLVIYIHGGGWEYGSKVGDLLPLVRPLVYDGYAVASINYRLSRTAKFPAQVQDVNCAVRFLKSKAQDYKIDSTNVGLVGLSAGGHLAALAGNASDSKEFTAGEYQNESSKVRALVSINGLLNLEATNLTNVTNGHMNLLFAGTNYDRADANPTKYLDKNDPPQMLIYSTNDTRVPNSQTLEYFDLLQQNNVPSQLLKIMNADHSLNPYLGLNTRPSHKEITNNIESFLNKYLKR